MRSLWLPWKESGVQQAAASPAPNLFDGVCTLVEGISWISNAGQRPSRPIHGFFGNDFSFTVWFGVLGGHHVEAMGADDASVDWTVWFHRTTIHCPDLNTC